MKKKFGFLLQHQIDLLTVPNKSQPRPHQIDGKKQKQIGSKMKASDTESESANQMARK